MDMKAELEFSGVGGDQTRPKSNVDIGLNTFL